MDMLFLFLVPSRSQGITLRGSYNDSCRRQQFRWSLAETWCRLSRHRVVHIHVIKEKRMKLDPSGKKGILLDIVRHRRYIESTSLVTGRSILIEHYLR
jgi:hypothetical protein